MDYVKGTKKHSQGNQQHWRADAVESHINHIIYDHITFCTAFVCTMAKTLQVWPLTALHAVQDEPQEDEGIVAVVNFHIFYNPLAHLSEVAGFGKLALVHKAGPRSNGHTAPVEPFFGYTDWESFGEPEPVEKKKRCCKECLVARAIITNHLYVLMSGNTNVSDISPTKDKRHSDNSNNNNKQQLFFMLSLTEIYCTQKALTLPWFLLHLCQWDEHPQH